MIKINGKMKNCTDISICDLLQKEKYDIRRIAVELNGDIVPKSQYENTILKSGDSVEIVSFVGGG